MNLIRKLALIILSASSLLAHAESRGFYLGAGVGWQMTSIRSHSLEFNFVDLANEHQISGNSKGDLGMQGVGGEIYAGYGYQCQNLYLGIEIFGQIYSSDFDSTFNAYDSVTERSFNSYAKLNMSGAYGIRLMPGFYPSPCTLAYLLVGVLNANFSSEGYLNEEKFARKGTNFGGLQAGLGLETAFTNQINLRLEYVHDFYDSKSIRPIVHFTNSPNMSPQGNEIFVSMNYHFG